MDHNTLQVYTRRHWNQTVFKTFLQLNINGISLDDRSGSGMTSITSWTLNVHCIKECNQIPTVVAQSLISNSKIHCVCACGVNNYVTLK